MENNQKKFVSVYGQRIHYVETGTGTEIALLLHAAGSDSSEWDSVTIPLARDFRVIAVDLPGHGDSSKPFVNYRLTTFADFLSGFCSAMNIEKVALLVGHSASGAAAILHELRHSEQVSKLVVVDPGYGFAIPQADNPLQLGHNPGTLPLLNPATRDEARSLLSLAKPGEPLDEDVDKLWAVQLNSAWAMQKLIESWTRREDTLDGKLGAVKTPTLILWGAEDKITPPHLGERMQREIPKSTLAILTGCGHSPHVERPAEFLRHLSAFLRVE